MLKYAACGWRGFRVYPTPVEWLPRTSQPSEGHRTFAFILTLQLEQRNEEAVRGTPPPDAVRRMSFVRDVQGASNWIHSVESLALY